MKRSTIISGIIGGIALWLFGFIFYALSGAMDGQYTPEGLAAMKSDEDMNIILILVGDVVIGIFAALIYDGWAKGTHNFKQGMVFGALLGILIGVGMNMIWYAVGNSMLLSGHVLDGIYNIVAYALTGGIISFVYSKMEVDLQ